MRIKRALVAIYSLIAHHTTSHTLRQYTSFIMPRSDATTIMSGGEYVDKPSIYVTNSGQVLGGCSTSYFKGQALAAGASKSTTTVRTASLVSGETASIPKGLLRSIYLETIDDLDDNTWNGVAHNDPYAQATFAEDFINSVQRYLRNNKEPAPTSRNNRATDLDLLFGSKKLPNSAATGLVPVRPSIGGSSCGARTKIEFKDDAPGTFHSINVSLPCTVDTVGIISHSRPFCTPDQILRTRQLATVKYTGTRRWLEEKVLAKALVLEPSLKSELQKLRPRGRIATNQEIENAEQNITNMFEAFMRREIEFGANTSRDLVLQQVNHQPFSERSRWRVQDVTGKPYVSLTMKPMEGQVASTPGIKTIVESL